MYAHVGAFGALLSARRILGEVRDVIPLLGLLTGGLTVCYGPRVAHPHISEVWILAADLGFELGRQLSAGERRVRQCLSFVLRPRHALDCARPVVPAAERSPAGDRCRSRIAQLRSTTCVWSSSRRNPAQFGLGFAVSLGGLVSGEGVCLLKSDLSCLRRANACLKLPFT